jgi:alanyl-tRNA synthetase
MDENYSIELCGGTHVMSTGELNLFKISSESAVAAGVRRIEALAGCKAEAYINQQLNQLQWIKAEFKNPKDLLTSIRNLQEDKSRLQKQVEKLEAKMLVGMRNELLLKKQSINGTTFLADQLEVSNPEALRTLCTDLKNELSKPYLICLTANIGGKAHVAICVNEESKMDAAKLIRETIAPLIKGGGGGQKILATAGGQDVSKLGEIPGILQSLL